MSLTKFILKGLPLKRLLSPASGAARQMCAQRNVHWLAGDAVGLGTASTPRDEEAAAIEHVEMRPRARKLREPESVMARLEGDP